MSARRRITVDYTTPDDPAPEVRRWPSAAAFILCAAVGAWVVLAAFVYALAAIINSGVSVLTGS